MKKFFVFVVLVMLLLLVVPVAAQEAGAKLIIESWRQDDITIWNEKILPAFKAVHPEIEVIFQPTKQEDYNGQLNTKLEGGTAGDIITCRPFDPSLALFEKGFLAPLNDLPGMASFGDSAKVAWTTDDGTTTYCVPMASVIHGFMYNKTAFEEKGWKVPVTKDEFFALLDAIKADGEYIPLAMGTHDLWEAATMGWYNIGVQNYKGEEGRLGIINGTAKFTDEPFVKTFEELAKWAPYLPDGYQAVQYSDAQQLFTMGKAAIFPTGSWEISVFEPLIGGEFEMGAFRVPMDKAEDACFISDHTDIGIGMNSATKYPEAARIFLDWVASAEFASLYANNMVGFFPLANIEYSVDNPVAQEFLSWRKDCGSSIRISASIIGRGEPGMDTDLWNTSANVINGTMTPADAAKYVQDALDKWYKPAK